MHMSVRLTWLKHTTSCQPKILINHHQDRYIHYFTQQQLLIVKIDSDDHVLWQQQYNDVTGPKYQLMIDSNTDALYLIHVHQQSLIISKLDADGHLIWTQIFPICTEGAISSPFVIIDDSYLYIMLNHICLFKLDANGQTVWKQSGFRHVILMILGHDKNLYLADFTSPINVVKVNQQGEIVWTGHHPTIKTQIDQSTLTLFFNDRANLSLGFISNDLDMGRNYVHYYVFNLNGHLIIDSVKPTQYMDPFTFPHNQWIYHLSKKTIHQINVVDGSEKMIEINGASESMIYHDNKDHATIYLASLVVDELTKLTKLTIMKHNESLVWTISFHIPTNLNGSCVSHMISDGQGHLLLLICQSQSQIGLLIIDSEMMSLVDLDTIYQLQNTHVVAADDLFHYTFSIKNRSKTPIDHVMINDTLTGVYTINGSIEPNESRSINACYRLTQKDLDSGQGNPYYLTLVNQITLCYENQSIEYQQEYRREMYTIGLIHPNIELTTSPPLFINSCNQTHNHTHKMSDQKEFMFTLTIKNTGNITFKKIWIDDPLLGMDHQELLGRSMQLFPGQQLSYTHQIVSDHLKHKVVENKATLNALTVHETQLIAHSKVNVISCIFPNMMIKLADGRQTMVQNLQKGDIVYPNRVVKQVYERPVINEMLEVVIFEPHCFDQQPERQLIMTGDYMIYHQGKKRIARKFRRQNGVHLVYHFAKKGTLYDILFVEHGSYWAHGMELLGGHPP